jgi:alkylhydroperoxidase/carboxymuconolactone decarboxylase family protein YurZ
MGWTTGQTPAQVMTALISAGALQDQAAQAIYGLAHKPAAPAVLWGVLVQCTTGWNSGAPLFEYDATPSAGSTGQTLNQAVTALVSAGAVQDQAVQALHSHAWYPGVTKTLWGVQVKCTTGWNSGAPVFSVNSTPS